MGEPGRQVGFTASTGTQQLGCRYPALSQTHPDADPPAILAEQNRLLMTSWSAERCGQTGQVGAARIRCSESCVVAGGEFWAVVICGVAPVQDW